MRNIYWSMVLLFAVLLSANFVSAEIPCSPECNIKGTIVSVNFTEMYYLPCALTNCSGKVPDSECCGLDTMPTQPAGYFLKIKIEELTPVSEPCIESYNCENIFPKNTEQIIFMPKDKVVDGDSFVPAQKIQGQVSATWGKSFDSYSLEDSSLECKTPSDCYPPGVEPGTDGGLFYQCSGGKCYEGSGERSFRSINKSKIGVYVAVGIILLVLIIAAYYFLRKKK